MSKRQVRRLPVVLAAGLTLLVVSPSAMAQQGQEPQRPKMQEGQKQQKQQKQKMEPGQEQHMQQQQKMQQQQEQQQRLRQQAIEEKLQRHEKKTLKGKVAKIKQVKIRGTDKRNTVVMLETKKDRNIIADLGPSEDLQDLNISEGTRIELEGYPTRVQDRPVLFVENLTVGNKKRLVKRQHVPKQSKSAEKRQSRQMKKLDVRQISGTVVAKKMVGIKGTDKKNMVVRLKTKQNKHIIADLGSAENLKQMNIEVGKRLSIQGVPIRIGDRLVLQAQEVVAAGKRLKTQHPESMRARRQARR